MIYQIEMEKRLRHDIAFRWFCKFSNSDITPFFVEQEKQLEQRTLDYFSRQ
jgi:transposase